MIGRVVGEKDDGCKKTGVRLTRVLSLYRVTNTRHRSVTLCRLRGHPRRQKMSAYRNQFCEPRSQRSLHFIRDINFQRVVLFQSVMYVSSFVFLAEGGL